MTIASSATDLVEAQVALLAARCEPELSVLELGGGQSPFAAWWAAQGGNIVSVDVQYRSIPELEAAVNDGLAYLLTLPKNRGARGIAREGSILGAQRLWQAYFERGIRPYVAADVYSLPFADQSFDRIYSLNFVTGLRNEKFCRALDEAWRVLRPGGKMVLAPLYESNLDDVVDWHMVRAAYATRYLIPASQQWGLQIRKPKFER